MTLRGAERANPALFEDLEPYRIQIRNVYAPLIWDVVAAMRAPGLDDVGRAVAVDLFRRLSRVALWAITEIRNFDELKYLSQRYISEAVLIRWMGLTEAKLKDKSSYYRDVHGHVDVRHEHVVPCEHLKRALATSSSPAETIRILERPVSCVVSLEEDHKLPKGGGQVGNGTSSEFVCLTGAFRIGPTWRSWLRHSNNGSDLDLVLCTIVAISHLGITSSPRGPRGTR